MQNRLRTPVLAITLASFSLLGFACGNDDGDDLDAFPTTDQSATEPTQFPETPPNGNGNENGNGVTPGDEPPEAEGQIGGTISAQGDVEGDFIPQSALATVEGDLQVLLANASGEAFAILVQSDGEMTMEAYGADQEIVVFTGSGAEVETSGDGTGVCGVQFGGTGLTDADGGNVLLNGALTITSANC